MIRLHNCARDPECRANDPNPPDRWYVYLPRHCGYFMLGLHPDHWSQVWLPFKGYVDLWSPIVWHPS